jgi:hypothetical protein
MDIAEMTLSLSMNTEFIKILLFLKHFDHRLKYQIKERILNYGQRLSTFTKLTNTI